mgnify:CR=1 FL=1
MADIVAIDIGGTHARFALATFGPGGAITLDSEVRLRTSEHDGLEAAWREYAARAGPLPPAAGIAIASPVTGDLLKMTNNKWSVRQSQIDALLGIDHHVLLNDFGAVAHAVANLDAQWLDHLCGPPEPLPTNGTISIIGPGTGLGVAQLVRDEGRYRVQATEGGHIGFAPVDAFEDALLAHLRARHGRVSVERVVSGPALPDICRIILDDPDAELDQKALWSDGLDGTDRAAAAAIDRFCLALGSVAGDIALAHGSSAIVIAGGVGLRLREHLARPGFGARIVAKGRYEAMLAAMPVKLITYPEPGLYGAAAAYRAAR